MGHYFEVIIIRIFLSGSVLPFYAEFFSQFLFYFLSSLPPLLMLPVHPMPDTSAYGNIQRLRCRGMAEAG